MLNIKQGKLSDGISLRGIVLFATLLNKVKRTIRKKKPDLMEIHQATIDKAKKLVENHMRQDHDPKDILIEEITLGEESDRYSFQFLDSYLGSQNKKVRKDPIYKDLDKLRLAFQHQIWETIVIYRKRRR